MILIFVDEFKLWHQLNEIIYIMLSIFVNEISKYMATMLIVLYVTFSYSHLLSKSQMLSVYSHLYWTNLSTLNGNLLPIILQMDIFSTLLTKTKYFWRKCFSRFMEDIINFVHRQFYIFVTQGIFNALTKNIKLK